MKNFRITRPPIEISLRTIPVKIYFAIYLVMTVLVYGVAYSDLDEFELRTYYQGDSKSTPALFECIHRSTGNRGGEAIFKAWIWPYYLSVRTADTKNSNPCRDFKPILTPKT